MSENVRSKTYLKIAKISENLTLSENLKFLPELDHSGNHRPWKRSVVATRLILHVFGFVVSVLYWLKLKSSMDLRKSEIIKKPEIIRKIEIDHSGDQPCPKDL